jgi:hypothetical protein
MASPRIIPLLFSLTATACATGRAASSPAAIDRPTPRSCGNGPLTVRGQVVDEKGRGIPEVMVLFGEGPCMTLVDHSGRFGVSGLPLDSIVVVASRPGFCVYPARVLPRGPGTVDILLPGLFAGNPLSDAMLIIHGTPWVPPDYEALRCLAESRPKPDPDAGARVPTPDQALDWSLNHPASLDVLERAEAHFGTVPLWFRYGQLGHEPPRAPIRYDLGRKSKRGEVYAVVLLATPEVLRVQLGYEDFRIHGSRESGLLLEWRRTADGWDAGTVLERWEPQPVPPPEPLTSLAVDMMTSALETVAGQLPSQALLCLKIVGDPLDATPLPPRMLEDLRSLWTVVGRDDCPESDDMPAGSVGPYGIFIRRPDFDGPAHAHVQVGLSGRESYDCVVQEVDDRLSATCRGRSP